MTQQRMLASRTPVPLSVLAAPSPLPAQLPAGTYTTSGQSLGSMVATPTGGEQPYSYAWVRTGGLGGGDFVAIKGGTTTNTLVLSDSSGAGRTVSQGQTDHELMRCTVTDAASTVVTVDVDLQITFSNF